MQHKPTQTCIEIENGHFFGSATLGSQMKSFKLFRPKGQALEDYNYSNSHDTFNLKHVLKSNASWLVDDAFSVAVARLDGARSNFEVCFFLYQKTLPVI